MLASKIANEFPNDVPLPAELRALCAFADSHDQEVSGCFEFETNGRASALAWFNNDAEAASRFAVFGCGPDGSLYALWLHAGPVTAPVPVVLLDSECEESGVIATDMRAFLRFLAIGYDEPGRYPTLAPENPDSAEELREWVESEYGLTAPETGAEIVAEARDRHPDLLGWVHEWQKRHFGTA